MKISGVVMKGLGLGKKLRLPPTMNVHAKRIPKLLRHGIYPVRISTAVGNFYGVLHYGPRPAVKAPFSFEVHAFGLKKKLYGSRVSVKIAGKRLRAVKDFRTITGLRRQIIRDIIEAKNFFKLH